MKKFSANFFFSFTFHDLYLAVLCYFPSRMSPYPTFVCLPPDFCPYSWPKDHSSCFLFLVYLFFPFLSSSYPFILFSYLFFLSSIFVFIFLWHSLTFLFSLFLIFIYHNLGFFLSWIFLFPCYFSPDFIVINTLISFLIFDSLYWFICVFILVIYFVELFIFCMISYFDLIFLGR